MLAMKQLLFGNEASSCFGSEGGEMLLLRQHANTRGVTDDDDKGVGNNFKQAVEVATAKNVASRAVTRWGRGGREVTHNTEKRLFNKNMTDNERHHPSDTYLGSYAWQWGGVPTAPCACPATEVLRQLHTPLYQ